MAVGSDILNFLSILLHGGSFSTLVHFGCTLRWHRIFFRCSFCCFLPFLVLDCTALHLSLLFISYDLGFHLIFELHLMRLLLLLLLGFSIFRLWSNFRGAASLLLRCFIGFARGKLLDFLGRFLHTVLLARDKLQHIVADIEPWFTIIQSFLRAEEECLYEILHVRAFSPFHLTGHNNQHSIVRRLLRINMVDMNLVVTGSL
mmetsp:Transcript_32964/g.53315  ORF Transcript_32964/g.53315 Transcript_32964/m.53315 type:complete len:202 (+) Transcript_32964:922-1527(+)